MKRFAIACAFALAACQGGDEPAADEAASEDTAVTEEASVAADGGPSVGTYEVTLPDGSMHVFVANEDGTFTSTDADGTVTNGTWRQDGPNRWCETEEGGEEACRTETVDENGVYTSTAENDPEDTVTVVRVD